MTETSLTLWIETSSCSCGNRWTNSFQTYPNGGTPNPQDELKLMPTYIIPTRRNHQHCFRCAPLGLGVGWQSCAEGAPAQAQSAKDLLA